MKRQDLQASFVIAAVWLLGITLYAVMRGPTLAGEEGRIYNAFGQLPMSAQMFADERAPKHIKLPIRWAHQRWGAV